MNAQADIRPGTGANKHAPIPAGLLAVFLVCAVLAALLIAYVLRANYSARLQQTSELLTNMGDEKLRLLDLWLTERKRDAEIISWAPDIQSAVVSNHPDIATASRTLADLQHHSDFSAMYVLDTSGKVIISTPHARQFARDQLWSIELPQVPRVFTITPEDDAPATPEIVVTTPIWKGKKGEQIAGVLVCITQRSALAAVIETKAEAAGVRTLFLSRNRSGHIVYFTQLRTWPAVQSWADAAAEPAVNGENKFLVRYSTYGERQFCVTRTVPELGWGMITRIIATQVERPFFTNVILTAMIFLVIVGIAILGLVAFWRRQQVHLLQIEIERRLAIEEKLRQSEERWKKAFRSSPEAIAISTVAGGRYLEVNDNFLKLFGFQSPEEVVGKTYAELNIWVHHNEREQIMEEISEKGHMAGQVVRGRDRAGRILELEISVESLQFQGVSCLMILGRDVTAQLQLEEQYRQSQKMEAVGRLAGGIAHDFNNMLAVISLSSELLLEEQGPDSAIGRRLAIIRNATERAAGLTRQLLAFSRQQVLQPQVTDVNTIVIDTKKMLERVIGEDVEIDLDLWNQPCPIIADAGQIVQILMNLAVNSRDAMPEGGKLTIRTAVSMLPNTVVHEGYMGKPHVLLSVSDTGTGIPPDVQERIFEPFFTTKRDGKGTGLGLATVYGIVQQSNGCIQLTSELGHGTTFHIYFPVAKAATFAACEQPGEEQHSGHGLILLVEDELEIRELARQTLASCGYEVETAVDGADALNKFLTGPAYDLLITDLTMPRMSGQALVAALREEGMNPRVLYISAYSEAALDGTDGTAPEFLQKPFARNDLLTKVRVALRGMGRGESAVAGN